MDEPFSASLPPADRSALATRLASLADESNGRSRQWHQLSRELSAQAGSDARWQAAAGLIADMAAQEEELARRIEETAARYRAGQSLSPPWSTPPGERLGPSSASDLPNAAPTELPTQLAWHPFPTE